MNHTNERLKMSSPHQLEERWSVSAPWVFRNTEYKVSADVREDVLVVQVEDCLECDQWTGSFDAKHIEELTRKTGNYKQFPIFLNMLESAITKSSDSVTLDLLTYADLESLRNKKQGGGQGISPNKQTQSKRYLILTYTVEFDRIHYPLALPYSGRPDPAHLQQTIQQLKSELERTKKQAHSHKHSDVTQLKREYEALAREKDGLEEALEAIKQDMVLSREGGSSKEMRFMKKVIKNLEEELLKERSKHQRYVSKKNEELKSLLQELEEVRLSERTLRTRVKSLSNELAVLKHGLRTTPASYSSAKKQTNRRRSTSTERRPHRNSLSAERSRGSVERKSMRTPSPSGARLPRFDPTAYVQNRRQKQREADVKLGKVRVSVRNRPPRSSSRERPVSNTRRSTSRERPLCGTRRSTSRNSSRGSSRRSSVSSAQSNISAERGRGSKGRRMTWESPRLGSTTPASAKRTTSRNSSLLDHSAEISEIDARLTALQEFMKRSLESSKTHTKR